MTVLPLAARLLLRFTDPRVREFISGDLEEAFVTAADAEGRTRATRWVVRQALTAAMQHPWRRGHVAQSRGDGFMRTFWQDLAYGVRTARRQPVFSFVIVLTLALAIGANTVIF